jgi:hypothetical protein
LECGLGPQVAWPSEEYPIVGAHSVLYLGAFAGASWDEIKQLLGERPPSGIGDLHANHFDRPLPGWDDLGSRGGEPVNHQAAKHLIGKAVRQ